MDLAPDFDEFCALLTAHHVEFVVIGAHALAFHGAPRFTGDLDLLVQPTQENGRRLLSAIAAFGFPTVPLTADDIVVGTKVIEMGVAPVQIHVMSQIDGVSWADVWESRELAPSGSREVPFIGREAFLRNKRAAGQPRISRISKHYARPNDREHRHTKHSALRSRDATTVLRGAFVAWGVGRPPNATAATAAV